MISKSRNFIWTKSLLQNQSTWRVSDSISGSVIRWFLNYFSSVELFFLLAISLVGFAQGNDIVCVGQPEDSFVADPTSCEGYYLCRGEVGLPGTCPDNLWFDPINIWWVILHQIQLFSAKILIVIMIQCLRYFVQENRFYNIYLNMPEKW